MRGNTRLVGVIDHASDLEDELAVEVATRLHRGHQQRELLLLDLNKSDIIKLRKRKHKTRTHISILEDDLGEGSRVDGEVGALPALRLILRHLVRPEQISAPLSTNIR